MIFKDLLSNKEFLVSTNIDLALYALAEDLGVAKPDILSGRYDKQFAMCKERIFKQLNKLVEG